MHDASQGKIDLSEMVKKAQENGHGMKQLNDLREKAGGMDQVANFIAENSGNHEEMQQALAKLKTSAPHDLDSLVTAAQKQSGCNLNDIAGMAG